VVSVRVKVKVLNATFNNISAISWRSVLLVEDAGVPVENNLFCHSFGEEELSNFYLS
jgi:hypothetical protein